MHHLTWDERLAELELLEEEEEELGRLEELEELLEMFLMPVSRIFRSFSKMFLPSGASWSVGRSFTSFSAALGPRSMSISTLSMAGPSARENRKAV